MLSTLCDYVAKPRKHHNSGILHLKSIPKDILGLLADSQEFLPIIKPIVFKGISQEFLPVIKPTVLMQFSGKVSHHCKFGATR